MQTDFSCSCNNLPCWQKSFWIFIWKAHTKLLISLPTDRTLYFLRDRFKVRESRKETNVSWNIRSRETCWFRQPYSLHHKNPWIFLLCVLGFFNDCNSKSWAVFLFCFFLKKVIMNCIRAGLVNIAVPAWENHLNEWAETEVRWKNMVAFALLGMQFSLMMDKYLVILEVPVTKFLNSMIHLLFSSCLKIYCHLPSTFI